jgi:hypothetical protein
MVRILIDLLNFFFFFDNYQWQYMTSPVKLHRTTCRRSTNDMTGYKRSQPWQQWSDSAYRRCQYISTDDRDAQEDLYKTPYSW